MLGFVNTENKGQYGVEQQLNERLSGRDGLLQSVTDVKNVPLNVGKDNVKLVLARWAIRQVEDVPVENTTEVLN